MFLKLRHFILVGAFFWMRFVFLEKCVKRNFSFVGTNFLANKNLSVTLMKGEKLYIEFCKGARADWC